ncbi:hypothetical protein MNBD_GAMMA16-2300 [hydrothermal vent metagenome]|uniref:Uncharacterized protein n=1 Tax=hydrothermal vent metagenome TaxID=652676 RepID=A0A3B1A0Y6_9ZZZZ
MSDPIGPGRIMTLLNGVGNGQGNINKGSPESRQGSTEGKASAELSQKLDHSDQLELSSAARVLNNQSRSALQSIATPQQANDVMIQIKEALVSGSGGMEIHSNAAPSLAALLKQSA